MPLILIFHISATLRYFGGNILDAATNSLRYCCLNCSITACSARIYQQNIYHQPLWVGCLVLTLNERILLWATFFTELILRIGFTCPPAMAAKPTLLNKSCSNKKILADLLFQL